MNNQVAITKMVERSIFWLILATVVSVPLIVVPHIFSNFTTSKTFTFIALTDLAFALYLYLAICYPAYRPKKNILLLSLGAFVLISIISAIRSVSPVFSFWSGAERSDGVLLLIHVFLFFVVVGNAIRDKHHMRWVLLASVLTSIVVAVSIYLGPLGLHAYTTIFGNQPGGGIIGNDSFAAVYLLFNLFFSAYLLSTASSRGGKIGYGVLALCIFCTPVFLNFSIFTGAVSLSQVLHHPELLVGSARGATLGLGIGILGVVLSFFSGHHDRTIRISVRGIFGIYLTGIAISIVLLFTPRTLLHNWFQKETAGYRYIYWHQALEGFKDHPVLGWGPETFEWVAAKYFDPTILIASDSWRNTKPHNAFLEVLVTEGILGFAAYLAIFITFFILLWRAPVARFTKALFSGVLIAYLLQNLILFDTVTSYAMLILLFGCIVMVSNTISLSHEPIFKKTHSAIGVTTAILAFVLVYYFAFGPLKESRARFKLLTLPTSIRTEEYERVRDLSAFGDGIDEVYTADLFYQAYILNFQSITFAKNNAVYSADIAALIHDVETSFQPSEMTYYGALTLSHLYDLYYQFGTPQSATIAHMETYAKRAIALSPTNPQGYWAYAQGLVYERNYTQALDVLQQARSYNPTIQTSQRYIENVKNLMKK